MKTISWIFCWLALGPVLLASQAKTERIHSFHSDVEIHADGSMTVTETITVTALGRDIKRGIYRDFPTKYRDSHGKRYTTEFTVLEAYRNGQPDEFRLEDKLDGKRVYIGKSDYFLKPGKYTYRLVYRTDYQLGYFDDHDELYWNVTGNEWIFPIDHASAAVSLPEKVDGSELKLSAYTGAKGKKQQAYTARVDREGKARFQTTQGLGPNEGLTIVVEFPTGIVQEPTREEKFERFIQANVSNLIVTVGAVLVLCYYFIFWFRYGIDPREGVVFRRETPPTDPITGETISPAAARFMMRQKFDKQTFVAGLINMAAKGYLRLSKEKSKFVIARDWADEGVLNEPERKLASALFEDSQSLEVKQSNHGTLRAAISQFHAALKEKHENVHFVTNRHYFWAGVVISIATLVGSAIALPAERAGITLFVSVWLTGWSFGVVMLCAAAVQKWRKLFARRNVMVLGSAVFSSLIALPFIAFEFFGLGLLFMAASTYYMVGLAVIGASIGLFYKLLKAPTTRGRQLMDEIEGFLLYLSDSSRALSQSGDSLPPEFERYVPYAIALDKEDEWTSSFLSAIQASQMSGGPHRDQFLGPSWYRCTDEAAGKPSDFFKSFTTSFSSAIDSASTAPGSSSGGGGGGSSGGGGGGGGGGGW